MKSAFFCLLLIIAGRAQAQQAAPAANDRAEYLSEQMVRDLHLNGYQSARLRAINNDKTSKLEAAERQYATDPAQLDQHAQAIARERDRELQAVLTNDQYTDYFDARKRYAQADRNYAHNAASAILVNSVQNPTPARANDATIGPARPAKPTPGQSQKSPSAPASRTLR